MIFIIYITQLSATFRKCHKFQLRISELAHGRNAASEIVKIILPQVWTTH